MTDLEPQSPGLEPQNQSQSPRTYAAQKPHGEPPPRSLDPDEPGRSAPWSRHDDERWIVEDAGRQPLVRPTLAGRFKAPPPDIVADGADVGGLTFRAASVRGIGHQERGEPRQDAYAVRFTQDQAWLVGCIADGVSEGRRSHFAATAIVDKVTEHLVAHLTRHPPEDRAGGWPEQARGLPWQWAVDAANDEVMRVAKDQYVHLLRRQGDEDRLREVERGFEFSHARRLMSSTALAFVVSTAPAAEGLHRAILANLAGDSSAFLLQDDRWIPLSDIKNEGREIYSGSVRSLPSNVDVDPHSFHLRPCDALLVMTDGLGDPLGSARGTVGAFLRERWRTAPDPLAFANHLAFYKKTFTDDRTAVMVWANPARARR